MSTSRETLPTLLQHTLGMMVVVETSPGSMRFLLRLSDSDLPGVSVSENLTTIAITEKQLKDPNSSRRIAESLTNLKSVIVVSEVVNATDMDDEVMPETYVNNRYQEKRYQQLLKLDEFVDESIKTAAKEFGVFSSANEGGQAQENLQEEGKQDHC